MATAGYVSDALRGEKNPYKAILRLAMPTVVAMLSQSVVNEVDVIFFAWLPWPESSNSQAALLPSLILVWAFGGSLSAISVGTQALVARRYAERRCDAAGAVLSNAMAFCVGAGALLSLLGLLLLPVLVQVLHGNPDVQNIILRYSRYRLLGVISMGMTMGIKAFFDGVGRTRVHLVAALVMNVCNVLLCWIFIYGNLGMPRMGAPGAGFAAFLSTWIGLGIMLWYAALVRDEYRPFRFSNLSRKLTWDILKLSIPAAMATVVMMIGFGLFSKIASLLDTGHLASAAHRAAAEAGEKVEAVNSAATTDIVEILKLTFTACLAFGTATATLVGQSLGAKKPEDAQKYGWASVRLGLVIFGVVGFCEGVLFTPQIVGFFSRSEAVREAAMMPMRIMGIVTPVIAVAMILTEALFGAGNPKFVAVAQFLLVFCCLVPLAYLFGIVLHMSLTGVWLAACVYSVLAAITMSWKFRQGSWAKIRL
jgi:putative MATE family efflux protein